MTDPLRFTFEVGCGVDHAFATWTDRIAMWWPADHTVTGEPAAVVLEGRVGGRLYECSPRGTEHEWGVVTDWRPPAVLSYEWHLGVGPESATTVTVTFDALDGDRTRVQIEQSGWERLGSRAADLRDRNRVGWQSLEGNFRKAVEI
jgi:uncharacterized protein YndB with AHSA1/START domain